MNNSKINIFIKDKETSLYKVYNVDWCFVQHKNITKLTEEGYSREDEVLILIYKNAPAFGVDGTQTLVKNILEDDMYVTVGDFIDTNNLTDDDIEKMNILKIQSYRIYENLQRPMIELRC